MFAGPWHPYSTRQLNSQGTIQHQQEVPLCPSVPTQSAGHGTPDFRLLGKPLIKFAWWLTFSLPLTKGLVQTMDHQRWLKVDCLCICSVVCRPRWLNLTVGFNCRAVLFISFAWEAVDACRQPHFSRHLPRFMVDKQWQPTFNLMQASLQSHHLHTWQLHME